MRTELHIAAGSCAIMKTRFLLLVTTALGSLCFAAASALGQNWTLTTQMPDASLYFANLIASVTNGPSNTAVWFRWGLDTNYGNVTPAIIVQGANALSISNLITGLTPYTTYHCQAAASNVFGTVFGGDVSFITFPKFVQAGANTDWNGLVMSADGRELVATRGGIIYVSTNVGAQFTPTTGTGSVIATSSDGSVVLSVSGVNIYVSMDRGSTWTTNNSPTAMSCFAASPDARNLAASDGSFYVYLSTNFGATWRQSIVPKAPTSGMAISADGSKIYGVGSAGRGGSYLYCSSDFGNTWKTPFTAPYGTSLIAVACSVDGTQVTAVGGVGGLITSTNAGASFSLNTGAPNYGNTVAMSADGTTQIMASSMSGGGVRVSPNAGTTWYLANPPYQMQILTSVMSSADGNTLAALITGGIYVAKPSQTGSLQVDLAPAGAVAAGAQWQLDGVVLETSGTIVTGLAIGNHTVAFSTVPGWTTPSNLTVSVFSNQTNVLSGTYIQQTGSLQVNLAPGAAVSAGAQWQVDGGAMQTNGATVNGLAIGNHTVSFTPVNGWITPSSLMVSITNNQTSTLTAAYLPADWLQVYLAPAGAVAAGAQWQVDGGAPQINGATMAGLTPGTHTVSFTTVSGWTTPAQQTFSLTNNQTNVITGLYTQQFGSLQVNIVPAGAVAAGAQWQVDGGAFQTNGAIVGGLAAGNHTVRFMAINGWAKPGDLTVGVANNQTNVLTATYAQVGSLQVNLSPPGAVSAGAQWQADGGPLQTNGAVVGGLIVGSHTVSFAMISGWSMPSDQAVNIAASLTNVILGSYTPATVVTNADQAALRRALAGGGTVNFSFDGIILLTNTIVISNNTVLDAGGHNIAISGGGSMQIFIVNTNATLVLDNLILADGLAMLTNSTGQFGLPDGGGAVSNAGVLCAIGCVFSNNSAIGPSAGSTGLPGQGGAIYNAGSLTVSNSLFVGNRAIGGAGSNPLFPLPGGAGEGGAIYNASNAVVAGCAFFSNTATGGTGADGSLILEPGEAGASGGQADGGAICNPAALSLFNSTFLQNTVTGGAGGAGGQGAGPTSGIGNGGPGGVGGAATDGDGGALCSLSGTTVVVNCTFISNSAFGGSGGNGGEGGYPSGATGSQGGAGGNGTNGANGVGGGICLLAGTLSLTNVTCACNLSAGGPPGSGGAGGALGYIAVPGPPGANGLSGMALGDTIADAGGVFLVKNSILDCPAGGTNASGPILDAGNNLNSDATGLLTNRASLNNTNPLLGTLGNYGGPTQTIPLLAGSPAIDAADPLAFPPTDQRGNPRPAGPAPDIGAFEFAASNAAQLAGMTLSHGAAQFVLNGQAGSICVIQVSSNLASWTAISTNTMPAAGSMLITDPGAASQKQRFYRGLTQ